MWRPSADVKEKGLRLQQPMQVEHGQEGGGREEGQPAQQDDENGAPEVADGEWRWAGSRQLLRKQL